MFCPHCRAEYRPGFLFCVECSVPLIESLPPDPEAQCIEYEEVFRTYNQGDIVTIRSVFDSEQIAYFIKGEQCAGLGVFFEPARIMVKKIQVPHAREILQELHLAFTCISLNDHLDHEEDGSESDEQDTP
ncbi:MAG TPA: DUF2007 domain-containing protein [Thermodesulfobacteriota bacterium]|nr:DUF2007 domain-containing protein [Thermodesulfobacteriota bacterium]HQO77877.1 DUF2007 domain-containing protein [Thermodesulfobacteriota bacterium]